MCQIAVRCRSPAPEISGAFVVLRGRVGHQFNGRSPGRIDINTLIVHPVIEAGKIHERTQERAASLGKALSCLVDVIDMHSEVLHAVVTRAHRFALCDPGVDEKFDVGTAAESHHANGIDHRPPG